MILWTLNHHELENDANARTGRTEINNHKINNLHQLLKLIITRKVIETQVRILAHFLMVVALRETRMKEVCDPPHNLPSEK